MKRRAQCGVAMIIMLVILVLGAAYLFVNQLSAFELISSAGRNHNTRVMNQAKQALIGYVARLAATPAPPTPPDPDYFDHPGRLPCPEAPGNYDNPANEGIAAGNCTLPAVGRLPWRTLGLDKIRDYAGEPLWYVVSPGWALSNSTTPALTTFINSNSVGQLTVDGAANDSVALIIAPGPAFSVPAAPGCAAKNQIRPTTGTPDLTNYLECENATSPADANFVTTGPSGSFNDHVLRVTAADVLPAIEAAIAVRIEREIAPLLQNIYAAPNWGLTGTDRLYPFAAPFSDPEVSSFTGSAASTQGQLPVVFSETFPNSGVACTTGPTAPRCNPTVVSWNNWATSAPTISYTGAGVTLTSTCGYWGPTDFGFCDGTYTGSPTQFVLSGTQDNGAMSLRQVRASATGFVFWWDMTNFTFSSSTPSPSLTLNSDGTLTVTLTASPPAPAGVAGVWYWMYVPGNATADHPLLDSRTESPTGWFFRNEWHKVLYYGLAPGYAASGAAPRSCSSTAPVTCLQVSNLTDPAKQRVILALAGRRLSGQARPSANLQDYLDSTENRNGDSIFEQLKVGRLFNDRFISVSKNP